MDVYKVEKKKRTSSSILLAFISNKMESVR